MKRLKIRDLIKILETAPQDAEIRIHIKDTFQPRVWREDVIAELHRWSPNESVRSWVEDGFVHYQWGGFGFEVQEVKIRQE